GGKPFCGTLDGTGGGAISGLSFPTAGSVGLFDTAYQATLQNFTLSAVTLGAVTMGRQFGSLAGMAAGCKIENITLSGFTHSGNLSYETRSGLGGLVGVTKVKPSTFTNCNVTGLDINLTSSGNCKLDVGGLVGNVSVDGCGWTNCSVTGQILTGFASSHQVSAVDLSCVGGLVGQDNSSSGKSVTQNCLVSADLSGGITGGIFGQVKSNQIMNCTFVGNASTSPNAVLKPNETAPVLTVGGIAGVLRHDSGAPTIDGCAVLGTISAQQYGGGILGYGDVLTSSSAVTNIKNCQVSGVVKGTEGSGGGLVGGTEYALTISDSYFAGQVEGSGKGGILGVQNAEVAISLTNVLFDSSLVIVGVTTIGGRPAFPECAVAAGDTTKWPGFATGKTAWIPATETHYPQLSRMTGEPLATIAQRATRKLFAAGGASSVYEVPSAVVTSGNFKSVHDAAITAAPDAAGAFSVASTDTAGGYQTYGLTTNATTSGTITFTYAGLTRPLSIPYRVGLKMFTYGSGTAADPYLIPDAATMEVFRKFV
ncbi:MAG: hypothetical protein RR211_04895, partial [Pseudoflavonifractor sp.]